MAFSSTYGSGYPVVGIHGSQYLDRAQADAIIAAVEARALVLAAGLDSRTPLDHAAGMIYAALTGARTTTARPDTHSHSHTHTP